MAIGKFIKLTFRPLILGKCVYLIVQILAALDAADFSVYSFCFFLQNITNQNISWHPGPRVAWTQYLNATDCEALGVIECYNAVVDQVINILS
ncbi:hypothetical protein BGW36DRAFT_128946 [Talaromyces proteolyticus]|uniref:Uncharacterized protein n=1 Tax=Talaromyces proteolyticus TaxID=1131652 RepID=A0AAD4PXU6_9EURO|nr:uncharacterized protein BGW36DRAFT_128946 [Talaromyces proteolyticus]KAH8700430.1 hypothetical protein BGW36DRAFT_128946 [Talaromyces proteolyticus]